jgi:hypothetical protein
VSGWGLPVGEMVVSHSLRIVLWLLVRWYLAIECLLLMSMAFVSHMVNGFHLGSSE